MITLNQLSSKNLFKDPKGNLWMFQYVDTGDKDLTFCNIFEFSYQNGCDIYKPYFTMENNERTFKQCYWPDLDKELSDTPIVEVLFSSDLLYFLNEEKFTFHSY